jgi:Fe-S-cluster-containing dehydrogenase component
METSEPNREAVEFQFSESSTLSCKDRIDCLARFDSYHFSIMAMTNEKVECDLSLCGECSISQFVPKIESRVDEANSFLESINLSNRVEVIKERVEEPKTKRELFGKLVGKISGGIKIDEVQRAKIEETLKKAPNSKKMYPLKHQILLKLLNENGVIESVEEFNIEGNQMINSININNSCTNCGDCIQFCPTEALFTSSDKLAIYINSNKCIGCGICSHICKVNAVTSRSDINSIELVKPSQLISFSMATCTECRTPFIKRGDEEICDRCIDFKTNFDHIFTLARDMK